MTDPRHEERPEEPRIVRDKRRIDPTTGQVREPAGETPPAAPAAPDKHAEGADAELRRELEERTADLQRVSAEYANYRRRVDRDREAVRELALANVLTTLLPVLDDIGRARDHGELEGPFRAVAEVLESSLSKLGLERYAGAGEPFDPTVHEALTHTLSADVDEPTCVEVFQPGYRLGLRVLRPARVAVAEPEGPAAAGE